jgi:hypothetical protein
MDFTIRVGRGALMKAKKPKSRAGELLDIGGCIFFDGARDIRMWSDETPGVTASEGQVKGFWVISLGCFPWQKAFDGTCIQTA